MKNEGLRAELCIFTCNSLCGGIGRPADFVKAASEKSIGALAITDLFTTEGYNEFSHACHEYNIKPIFGATAFVDDIATIYLAKNKSGIRTINTILSFGNNIEMEMFEKHATDDIIVIGILNDADNLEKIAEHFDYIGIDATEPLPCELVFDDPNLEDRILALSCPRYAYKEDKFIFDAMAGKKTKGFKCFKDTRELINMFGEKYVIENPNRLIEEIEEDCYEQYASVPVLDFVNEKDFITFVFAEMNKKYPEGITDEQKKRLYDECTGIVNHGYQSIFFVAQMIAKFLEGDFLLRGAISNSYVAYILGISKINPLDFDLHHGVFLGYDYSRRPVFQFEVSKEKQSKAYSFLKERLCEGTVFKASTNSTLSEKGVTEMIQYYLSINDEVRFDYDLKNAKVFKLLDTKIGGEVVEERFIFTKDLNTAFMFSPIKTHNGELCLSNDYSSSLENLESIVLHESDLVEEIIKMEKLLDIKFFDLPLDDEKILSLLESDDALNKKQNIMDNPSPFIGIKGLSTEFITHLIEVCRPRTIDELVKVVGMTHGTNVWVKNADRLFEKGFQLQDVIGNRDDIFDMLTKKYGVKEEDAFSIMEGVRKGRGLKPAQKTLLNDLLVDSYLIESMDKIAYAFPKSYSINFVATYLRLAYIKVYHHDVFYKVIKEKYKETLKDKYEEMINMDADSLLEIINKAGKSPEKELASILLEEKERM